MGNRAFITDESRKVGVYLHWNGGRDSVEAFLEYCKRKGCRGFGQDTSYGMARLVQVVANFFGGTGSIGISPYPCYDDNGVYIVKGWDIVGRKGWDYNEDKEVDFPESWEQHEYDLEEMIEEIDSRQPEGQRLKDKEV